ncbi:MAG: alkaline phosphatase family protein [Thermoplasmata archaeon]|nr:alkaline phosphatase family protein [Thermoplasmata archaeon]
MTPPPLRFLVLGLDGGTFDLLDPLMEAGELPFLKSLVQRGFRAPLASVYPPKTIPAWYSFATGQDPGSLGIFGFTEPDGGPGKSRIVQTFRPAEAFWDLLSRRGLRVGVLNFPLRSGYPLNGFFVPGMLSEHPPTYPAHLQASLETELGEPYLPELPAYRESDRSEWIGQATRGVEQRGRAAKILCDQYRPDFMFVLFRETDRVQHQHWSQLARPHDEIPADLLAFWRGVDSACAQTDHAFRALGGPCVTLVISDHGHGAACADFFTNRWLLEEKYLTLRHGGESWRRRVLSRALLASDRIGPFRRLLTPLADRLRGGARRERVGRLLAGESSFEAMASKIDWKRTIAFSYPVPEGIYLNRYNPELTPERTAAVVDEIRQKLERYPEAHVEVFDPKAIYRGTNLDQAPALLLRVDDMATELRMDFSYARPMLRHRPAYFYGSGVHRMNGILIASGDGVPGARSVDALSLLDIAPTVLEGMGVPTPAHMTGRTFGSRLWPSAS